MPTTVRSGPFEVRLARDEAEIRAAQALRYRVFVEEMGAEVDGACHAARRDVDRFDAVCDHLLVLGQGERDPAVLGCYRLLRHDVATRHGGFYTAGEFAIGPLARGGQRICEVGRSCVDPAWRQGAVVQLLWRGIAEYLEDHAIDLLFGCASLPGTDPDALAPALTWLHHHHRAPAAMRPRALRHRHVRLDRMPLERVDPQAAQRMLPPLVKGYLRLGGMIGDGAVIDLEFHTTDVCVVLPTDRIAARYRRHYAAGPSARPAETLQLGA